MDEQMVLATDPFAGDFGSPGDRTLKDKMGTARKAGECQDCGQMIQPGERIRLRTDIFDGELMSFRWCQLCCEAMAISGDDDMEAWSKRIAMRTSDHSASDQVGK